MLIPVTELKQWAYCPRIVYYHGLMAEVARPTYKMQEAVRAQEMIEGLEMRRSLQEYGLEKAERQFGVWLSDEGVGLSGKIDLLLRGPERLAVVDFKLTAGEVGENHRMQLTGYALLVEARMGGHMDLAFLYRIPDNHVFPVPISEEMKERASRAVAEIRAVREKEQFPAPTGVRSRCVECEYANYCGDVW